MAKALAQLKTDVKRSGWPWPIDHPNDERALLNGCRPDFRAAERVREFFAELLVLPQEGGGTRPFELLNWWYRSVLGPLFGWKRIDGRRRFDKAFVTTAKKSAKSTVAAGLSLYMLVGDGEEEAECYSAATDRDQAAIIHNKTARMVKLSPELSGILTRVDSQKRIVYQETGGVLEAISSDADSAEGKNPHLLIADELHVWRDRQFFNALMYGDIARSQPLFLMITTAGDDDATGVGFEEYEFAKDLLNPNNEFYSESHFAFIAEAAPGREWDDPEGWKEANPSLLEGSIGSVAKLQAKCQEAKQSPRKRREFERYICNRWQSGVDEGWLDQDCWAASAARIPAHEGDACYAGLDLSKTVDLTALALCFRDGKYYDFKWYFWMPEDVLKKLEVRDRAPYRDWVRNGFIEATPGNTVDYAYIRRRISGIALDANGQPVKQRNTECLIDTYDVKNIAFDPYNSSKLVTELTNYDGVPMIELRQGYLTISSPSKEFERLVLNKLIRHGNNPVVNWMAGHCCVDTDPAGNIKPSKLKSRQKIDGIVAAVMALALAAQAPEHEESIYESRDLLIL